ncbi:hypothetical protein CC86DRAFT_370964 [Ophiobolus disseminans]|uniref:Protein Zds1 C-terminal domain-containing protein n=1 Tax=Ophiobolus disseminans TaxID=1469910 RepID=A0A6A6ZWJ7_9PLEO|nr:hypothetical protein CC86DRAFT_370964 [Ophiobolus disseminans]
MVSFPRMPSRAGSAARKQQAETAQPGSAHAPDIGPGRTPISTLRMLDADHASAPSQANDRARELERVYQMRRGHVPQISISDDNHHVTEAIGDLYGGDSDTEPSKRNSRPLSFIPSPNGDSIQSLGAFEPFDPFPAAPPAPARSPLRPQMAPSQSPPPGPNGTPSPAVPIPQKRTSFSHHHGSPHSPLSPPLSRTNSDTAEQQFPLNDVDYESSPAGLAQELSNLQAIRRMSMGVNNADPDLPSFKSSNGPPSPPGSSEDNPEGDLFWVPARLHPELAPMEFKTFIEEKVNTIRRRSGDSDSLSPDGALGRQASGGGLRRKKSMLSRQIDSGAGYKDGAERLERKRSGHQPNGGLPDLQELEQMTEDPAELVRRMSLSAKSMGSDGEAGSNITMAPGKFGGIGTLKRSTHTTYRRGSLRKGGPPLSRRLGTRQAETDTEDSPNTSPTHSNDPEVPPLPGLGRVQSEPVNGQFEPSNFSRPRVRSPPSAEPRPGSADEYTRPASSDAAPEGHPKQQPKAFHSRIASNGRTSAHLPGYKPPTLASPVPQIIETPPPQEPERRQQFQPPERNSSRQPPPPQQPQQPQPNGQRNYPPVQSKPQPPPQRQSPQNRPNRHAQAAQASPIQPAQSFDDLVGHPSPLPGNTTRTDNLSIIPNLPEEKKSDKKLKDKKESSEGPRKTSWGWLVGGGDKDKASDKKEKEDREKESAKKVKNKLSKPQEKGHDDTRLDLLQTSIQGTGQRGRESVVLDRESVKLEEERKKESQRKTSSDGRKEKEPGLLSSIFGGGKKKGEKEASHKKTSARGLSPEPPPKVLKPDIDYNWTRFSILEERAIYRMAHIKLANPRRELYSQVLLSNFMYSYLAKVQQMHPQIQIGNSKQARQAKQQEQKKEQQQQQPPSQPQSQPQPQNHSQPQQPQNEEFAQYQRYQQQQQDQQPEQSNEWPSVNQKQNGGQRQPQENGHHTNAYNQNPRDSHHSQHSANGGGYSVANTQNYLGQGGKSGYHQKSDSDQSSRADDEMW